MILPGGPDPVPLLYEIPYNLVSSYSPPAAVAGTASALLISIVAPYNFDQAIELPCRVSEDNDDKAIDTHIRVSISLRTFSRSGPGPTEPAAGAAA